MMEKQGKAQNCDVSIIILTKNGGRIFRRTLEMVFKQGFSGTFEVVIIDSGSTDGTLALARKYQTRVIQIEPHEFGHGRTRNLGADLAHGRFVVYLTQDAVPTSPHWLERLTANLRDNRVAAAFGRQIPYQHTSAPERFLLHTLYPEKRIRKSLDSMQTTSLDNIFFSNVNSVVRKSVWQNYRFAEDLIMSEDQEWAKQVLLGGHVIVYDPEAAVFHSHNYSLGRLFRRNFDSAYSLRGITEDRVPNIIGHGLRYVASEMAFLIWEGLWYMIPYALLYEACRAVGLLAGRYGHLLPLLLRKHLSLHSQYWSRIRYETGVES